MKHITIILFMAGLLGVHVNAQSYSAKLLREAEAGDNYSQYYLACAFYYGRGTQIDYQKSLQWFCKVAEREGMHKGDALRFMGEIYLYGKGGVSQDTKQGMSCLERAFENGNRYAGFVLGNLYNQGEYVKQNNAKAFNWWKKVLTLTVKKPWKLLG